MNGGSIKVNRTRLLTEFEYSQERRDKDNIYHVHIELSLNRSSARGLVCTYLGTEVPQQEVLGSDKQYLIDDLDH